MAKLSWSGLVLPIVSDSESLQSPTNHAQAFCGSISVGLVQTALGFADNSNPGCLPVSSQAQDGDPRDSRAHLFPCLAVLSTKAESLIRVLSLFSHSVSRSGCVQFEIMLSSPFFATCKGHPSIQAIYGRLVPKGITA